MAAVRLALALALGGCLSEPARPTRMPKIQLVDGATQPGPMVGPRLVFDSDLNEVVMFAGATNNVLRNSMWAFDGTIWSQICLTGPGPAARWLPAVAYSSTMHALVVAGGMSTVDLGTASLYDDAYACTGDTWSSLASLPDKIAGATLVDNGQELISIGGVDPEGEQSFEFAFSNGKWKQYVSAPASIASAGTSAAFAKDEGRVLAFRDQLADKSNHDTLYAQPDSTAEWITLCDSCTGTPRQASTLVHVPDFDETFLIDGEDTDHRVELGGVWQLVVDKMVQISTEPAQRDSVGAAWDPSRGEIVIYGGNGPACNSQGLPGMDNPNNQDCDETWVIALSP
jgi:hypothetical protein